MLGPLDKTESSREYDLTTLSVLGREAQPDPDAEWRPAFPSLPTSDRCSEFLELLASKVDGNESVNRFKRFWNIMVACSVINEDKLYASLESISLLFQAGASLGASHTSPARLSILWAGSISYPPTALLIRACPSWEIHAAYSLTHGLVKKNDAWILSLNGLSCIQCS